MAICKYGFGIVDNCYPSYAQWFRGPFGRLKQLNVTTIHFDSCSLALLGSSVGSMQSLESY